LASDSATLFIDAAKALAPQIRSSAEDGERERRLSLPVVEAMARAGLYQLRIPRALGGEETDPMTLVRVI
jgi:alkylation response protein AidB-like acyl-CoA dehydrogenase